MRHDNYHIIEEAGGGGGIRGEGGGVSGGVEEEKEEEGGGDKGGPRKLLYLFLHSHNEYLFIPPFLRYMPTDHSFRLCSSLKSQLRLEITSQYFTGILIQCMATTYVLFMTHMHVL
jgi:hypothetical protein